MHATVSGRYAIPRQRKSMLARPRLTWRLHGAIGSGLSVLHAPVGAGKTALLTEFVQDLEYNVRWLTLDASASVPEVFAQQLAAALNGEASAPSPASAEKPDDLRAYLGAALRLANECSGLPLLVVVDNVHEVAGSEASTDLLGYLIENLPAGGEVILSGRAMPPLTEVERRIATGECLLLENADLAFTEAEIALLLQEGSELRPSDILAATRGWPSGVMALLAGGIPAPGAPRTRTSAAWEQYLSAEVWAFVPEETRAAMMRVAIAPATSPALGRELIGRPAWVELTNWLANHDFLYESLPGEGIRLNPILRDFVRLEFERTDPAGFEACVRAVVDFLEGEDALADAIEVAKDGAHVDALVGLLQRHARSLILKGSFVLVERGFTALPANVLQANPVLDALHARGLAHTGKLGEALDVVDDVLAQDTAPVEARIHALLARYRALRLLGRPDQLASVFEEARKLGPVLDPSLIAELRYHEAHLVLALDSNFDQAEALLQEALRHCRPGRSSPLDLLTRSTLGQLLAMRGQAPAAVAELTAAARGWRDVGGSSNLGWVLNNLGMAHVSVGDFQSAASALEAAREEGQSCENTRNLAYATASLGDAELALGHYEKAKNCFEEAIRMCSEEVPDESLASLSIAGLAGALLGQGDVREADYFIQRALHIAETLGNPYEFGTCLVQHAAIASAAQDHSTAISAARRAIGLFKSINGDASLRVAYYRLAICQFRANRRGEAQTTLQELVPHITEPWQLAAFLPAVREQPMFAQWVASRGFLGPNFRSVLDNHDFHAPDDEDEDAAEGTSRLPRVVAKSLGHLRVTVSGRDVSDEAWASARAKELFFLFLANPDGLRKEEAVERLYPDIEAAKCNSVFHSNLYRIRRALYQDSVVKRDGAYMLNPDGEFDWDVDRFEDLYERATRMPAGSDERANLYRKALELYRGPFAEAFYSEWAETVRQRTEETACTAMSTLAGFYAGRDDFEAAAGVLQRLLERNRLNEEAAYQLATYRVRAGNPAGALSFLDDFGRTYRAELGEGLPPRFRELRHQIASGVAV
ncbi:MAG: tetratricopeptide repeat protein [Dehalococcoidia bacterium]|nr:tetratricopeptide repeat protein [Dehalococcoidia bacterium]